MTTIQKQSRLRAPAIESFRFDAEAHKYFVGRKEVPGVSDILAKVGLSKNYKGVDSFYRDRGIACHKAIELYLKGILDPATLDEAIKHQFEGFLGYWDQHMKEKIIALETPFCDRDHLFAGTPDLVTDQAIYDWKCSKDHDRVADLQGQAYKTLIRQCFHETDPQLPFIVVELHEDGSTTEFNYGSEMAEWPSVMSLYDWKTR